MFGYVTVNQKELKFREYDLYRSYYCGLCRELNRQFGLTGRLTLSYDMTFLILLLSDLYDTKDEPKTERCIVHPLQRHEVRVNQFTEYAAKMNIILSYYSLEDDWHDERKVLHLLMAKLLKGGEKKAAVDYGKKAAFIKDRLDRLHICEQKNETDIDRVSGLFGEIMGELFAVYDDDEWSGTLRRMGFFLGKFIYIMDAYDDLEKDQKKGNYNPLLPRKDDPDFESFCHQILTMMMAQCCEAFELLPCIGNVSILRNILYSGVWTRYNALQAKKSEQQSKEKDSVNNV
ncbi:MAG: DUF5685 family protein [Lachnospiraceae bacterium]|jgi:hypothetical protein|nr:DUF5685 family protein [Lachnospiraceae bacterium]